MYRFNSESDSSAPSQIPEAENSNGINAAFTGPHKHLPSKSSTRHQLMVKRGIDILGASVLILILSPLYFFVALCVMISMGRPIRYWQNRLGKHGRRFRFYKFRSMLQNSEDVLEDFLSKNDFARTEWDTFQKLAEDPRITPVGRIIRRFSLDELPQIFCVLKGDMSLVGPRPCMESQRLLYGKNWKEYCAMRPGITGLWQVSGRNRLPYSKRVELDAFYVHNWSLWLDVKILFKTFGAVINGEGCH